MLNSNIFHINIKELTPSQLYISNEKMQKVNIWFDGDISKMNPIPIKKLAGRMLMTDGHTRTVAAFLRGCETVPCVWDEDDLDWAAYAADINMCAEEGITSVEKLAKRIVSKEDYQKLWIGRCDTMYDEKYYKRLKQEDETIFFTKTEVKAEAEDIRPWLEMSNEYAEYFRLFKDGKTVAQGCIERYSFEFWEITEIKTMEEFSGNSYATEIAAFLTNKIVTAGKTATYRTLPENIEMNGIIEKCGYKKLYS